MKFPSIFRTASPMRFDIKPRHYDPVKEEIEQRTARIKRELEAEGLLSNGKDQAIEDAYRSAEGSSIRGAFTQGSPIRNKPSALFSSAGMLRMIILLVLVGTITGYLYWGIEALYTLLYIGIGIAVVLFLIRLKGKTNE
ncbi:hypothetical protein [Echinicola vietnamensis]|uniref:Uncharacterized protein n=1 Tax=Echinicola vietnamensis (strain DSM 17526 / LMG 23754 / KMM 6221) TaxID=926556 RepID=L0FT35_ECHVK|nr:hypothetical protein [Echinicola vietnamensis]AGA77054.1 hypothetical protein Echvi_0779 [Echinicola vietnamensis DSM 17526]